MVRAGTTVNRCLSRNARPNGGHSRYTGSIATTKPETFLSMKGQLLRRTFKILRAVVPISLETSMINFSMIILGTGTYILRCVPLQSDFDSDNAIRHSSVREKLLRRPNIQTLSEIWLYVKNVRQGLLPTKSIDFSGLLPITRTVASSYV